MNALAKHGLPNTNSISKTMNTLAVKTPNYVLLDGKVRLGPKLCSWPGEANYQVIYGFSDKQPYDLFCANCQVALTPYPLVKGYLRSQLAEAGDAVQLVAIDAASPQDALLYAATISGVLAAQEKQAESVSIAFHLTLDEATQAYRVQPAVAGMDMTTPSAVKT